MNTQNKIKKISKTFHYLFLTIFVAIPVSHILSWSTLGKNSDLTSYFFIFNFVPLSLKILHPLTGGQKFLGFLISGIEILIIQVVVFYLIQLFKLYQKAEIFTLNNVRYFKKIGFLLLFSQLFKPICQALLSFVLTFKNPLELRVVAFDFTETNICILIAACLMILISWIMVEGCQLREEQQLTV